MPFGGGELSFGVVVDLDAPLESGVYLGSGSAGGGNVGVGVAAGYSYGNIEGGSEGVDVGGLPGVGWGGNYGTGDDGQDYAGVSYGIGTGGVSGNQMHTDSFSIQDLLDKINGKNDEEDDENEPDKTESDTTEELPPT